MDSKGFLSEGEISKLVRVKIESFLHNNPNCKKAEMANDILVKILKNCFVNYLHDYRAIFRYF